jgi:hypothetical protein
MREVYSQRTICVDDPAAYHHGPLSPYTRHTVDACRRVAAQVALDWFKITIEKSLKSPFTCRNIPDAINPGLRDLLADSDVYTNDDSEAECSP